MRTLLGHGILLTALCTTCAVASGERPAAHSEPMLVDGRLIFPEGSGIPRSMTEAEKAFLKVNPLQAERGGASPEFLEDVRCPGEYEPMQGILLAWEGLASWNSIQARMATYITTTGNADVYIMCDTPTEATNARNAIAALTSPSANMSRVYTFVTNTDTIWIRDYGPRYIYEGNVRSIVDHTYNRNRPADNAQPTFWANTKKHTRYAIPLIHGGGNYHLNGIDEGWATQLIVNENPGLSAGDVVSLWQQFQNVTTTLTTPFPVTVDSTQHIDMWMQIAGDRRVMISDWSNPPADLPNVDVTCDTVAAAMASNGWTVQRIPAFRQSGIHYTYTNVVICNDLILVPQYSASGISSSNATALNAWRALRPDLPPTNVVGIVCDNLVSAAGVMHCIVMHVPAPIGGTNPTAYLRTLRGPEVLAPGSNVDIRWSTDDDVGVSNVDLLLSTDGGATFPTVIASATADDGVFTWTVPNVYAPAARIRVVARDAFGNTGFDDSRDDLFINAPPPVCVGDADGNGVVEFGDINAVLTNWGQVVAPFATGDADGSGFVDFGDIVAVLGNWGAVCP